MASLQNDHGKRERQFFGPGCIITISSCRNSGKLSTLSYAQRLREHITGLRSRKIKKKNTKKTVEEGGDVRVTHQEKKLCWPTPFIMFTFNKRSNQDRIKF